MENKKENRVSYGKIIAITLAVVAGACAVIWFALKLYRKYCLLECDDYDEFDELAEDGLFDENAECEVVIDGDDAEDAIEDAAQEA